MTGPDYFLGVDGGATRCRARLRDRAGQALAEAEGPAANIYVGFDAALAVVLDVASEALRNGGVGEAARPRVALGLGLAGLSSEDDAKRVVAALSGWASVRAANDAVAACLGAHAGADGGLIIAGTGSAGLALVDGRTTIVGGRGFLLGDDGAAARIGADAVRAALRAFDQLEPISGLSQEILDHFGNDPLAMMDWALTAKPGDYGAFAPLALSAAERGEEGARIIVAAAVQAIVALVHAVEASGARRIAITGGLAEPIRGRLPADLAARLLRPLFDPADGAVLLAGGVLQLANWSAREMSTEQLSGSGKLYKAIGETLKREIASGRFAETQVLPGERTLCEMFDISRTTLRRAIVDLVAEGLLFHRHGAGTFIRRAAPRVDQPTSRLTGFTEDMRLRGFAASSRELERGVYLPTPEEAMMLGVGPSERVMRLSRLRLASDKPMAIEHAVVPCRFLPDLDAIGASLYDALEARQFRPARGLERLRATLLSDADAALLEVESRSPALYIQRIAYLADGQCVEFTRSYYRGDAYDFVSELTLSGPARKGKSER